MKPRLILRRVMLPSLAERQAAEALAERERIRRRDAEEAAKRAAVEEEQQRRAQIEMERIWQQQRAGLAEARTRTYEYVVLASHVPAQSYFVRLGGRTVEYVPPRGQGPLDPTMRVKITYADAMSLPRTLILGKVGPHDERVELEPEFQGGNEWTFSNVALGQTFYTEHGHSRCTKVSENTFTWMNYRGAVCTQVVGHPHLFKVKNLGGQG